MKSHIFRGIAFLVVALLGFSLAVMLLWNALLPVLFGVPVITFFQAMGLLVLARLLLGGIGCGHKHMGHGRKLREKHASLEKWLQMTPEEQAIFSKKVQSLAQDVHEDKSSKNIS